MIDALARQLGLPIAFLSRAADRREALDEALARAIDSSVSNIVVSTGGVSVGDLDLIRSSIVDRGAQILFHGVRMRPGKPILFALLPDGRPYFGLPGNPVAALVGFRFFVVAALRRMLALSPEVEEPVESDAVPRPETTLFLRGIRRKGRCCVAVDTSLDQRSHVLRSTISADTWLRVEASDGTPVRTAYPKQPNFWDWKYQKRRTSGAEPWPCNDPPIGDAWRRFDRLVTRAVRKHTDTHGSWCRCRRARRMRGRQLHAHRKRAAVDNHRANTRICLQG